MTIFGISTLTNRIISIGGKVEFTDFNAFTALQREISEEIGDTNFSAKKVAGSQVLVENDIVLVFWDVENSENIKLTKNSEIEKIIWLTKNQLQKLPRIDFSTVMHPFLNLINDIIFNEYYHNDLPLNYDMESEKIYETKTLKNYEDFLKDFSESIWYIVYIYKIEKFQFKYVYFMKTEKEYV